MCSGFVDRWAWPARHVPIFPCCSPGGGGKLKGKGLVGLTRLQPWWTQGSLLGRWDAPPMLLPTPVGAGR